jgi:DNA polymerase I
MAAGTRRLHLIDGSGYIYRAFHAIPGLRTGAGVPTNAAYGFATMVAKLLREERPEHVVVVFDAPGGTFRDDLFAQYKQHRPPMPDDLKPQLPLVRRIVAAMRLPAIEYPGVEADDVIGTLAAQASRAGIETVIVTGDKDMMQLVDERTTLLDTMRDRRVGVAEVRAKFGVGPDLVPDVLGLMGDAVDNIPGVTGVGEKTATALVSKIGAVETILDRLEAVETIGLRGAKKVREALAREAETARLSKQLAIIRCDVPLSLDLDGWRWVGPDPVALRPLFQELEFHTLARELAPAEVGPGVEVTELADPAAVVQAVRRTTGAGPVAVVATFDSARATSAHFTELVVATAEGPVLRLGDPDDATRLALLEPILADLGMTRLGANLKALRVALAQRRVRWVGGIDLALAAYCLNPSAPDHGLAALAEEYLGWPAAQAASAAGAARAAQALYPILMERLRQAGLEKLFREVESPLADVLAEMELAGIAVDVDALGHMSAEFAESLERLMGEIHALAGGPFNIGSPPQLREVLFERLKLPTKGVRKGKTGLSTDADVLAKLAGLHPLPQKILDWRQLSKLKSTYVDALPSLVDSTTGRLHTSFNQTVAATGRLSSSDPNLQNIPIRTEEGRRIRAAFVAPRGARLISADYSQIELRVLAHLADDAALKSAFQAGDDVHARTASEVFGNLPSAEGRRMAKVINYGIVYGMGPSRAARELGCSLADAERYIADYFARYAGVKRYIDTTIETGRARGYVTTILGRRRYFPELTSPDPGVRQFAERAATNTPIQGSAADLIKLAMLAVRQRLAAAGNGARMLLQVHDELVLEAPAAAADSTVAIVRDAMEGVWALQVPLRVDVRVGSSWAEIH